MLFLICSNVITFANNDFNDTIDTIFHTCPFQVTSDTIVDPSMNSSLSDSLTYTTALINALNNAISIQNNNIDLIAIIVAVIGVLATLFGVGIAIAGIIGFRDLKEDLNGEFVQFKTDIKDNIIEIKDEIDDCKRNMNDDFREYKEGIGGEIKEFMEVVNNKLKEFKDDVNRESGEFKLDLDNRLKECKEGMEKTFREYIDRIDDVIKKNQKDMHENLAKNRDSINESVIALEKEFNIKIAEINELKTDVERKTYEIEKIANRQDYQNQYLKRINEYLFSITNSVVDSNGGGDETASVIRNSLYNQYYIVKIFLPWSDSPTDSTEAAFRYLQVNGTIENVEDLSFIVENDPDENKRKMAIETIGYIKSREMNIQI